MEITQQLDDLIVPAENDTLAPSARRPFVEPTLTPAGDVFDVTRNYLFMIMNSGVVLPIKPGLGT